MYYTQDTLALELPLMLPPPWLVPRGKKGRDVISKVNILNIEFV